MKRKVFKTTILILLMLSIFCGFCYADLIILSNDYNRTQIDNNGVTIKNNLNQKIDDTVLAFNIIVCELIAILIIVVIVIVLIKYEKKKEKRNNKEENEETKN